MPDKDGVLRDEEIRIGFITQDGRRLPFTDKGITAAMIDGLNFWLGFGGEVIRDAAIEHYKKKGEWEPVPPDPHFAYWVDVEPPERPEPPRPQPQPRNEPLLLKAPEIYRPESPPAHPDSPYLIDEGWYDQEV
jgi:hypothetical protein